MEEGGKRSGGMEERSAEETLADPGTLMHEGNNMQSEAPCMQEGCDTTTGADDEDSGLPHHQGQTPPPVTVGAGAEEKRHNGQAATSQRAAGGNTS